MIKIDNISKRYNDIPAIEDVSFKLNKGEIVGFLGVNGAGKSTTMKIITGVIQASSGSVNIFGYDIEKNPIEAKKKIGYLSEDNPLPENMYVKEYLEYVAELYQIKQSKKQIQKSIEDFGLKNEYKKKIQALSKGNRQKLGLAQALIHNPDFLILDEPMNALDPNQQSEIKEMITDLGKSKTILFSTHALHDIENLANRIIIMEKGKLATDQNIENIESVEDLFYSITHENNRR